MIFCVAAIVIFIIGIVIAYAVFVAPIVKALNGIEENVGIGSKNRTMQIREKQGMWYLVDRSDGFVLYKSKDKTKVEYVLNTYC